MNELSLYILDIAQNSIAARAQNIEISINENRCNNFLIIEISDDGKGINKELLLNVTNPFYTTRTSRKVGLGLPLLREICELSNGSLEIQSIENVGTKIKAVMEYDHLDRLPIGNIVETIYALILNNQIDLVYQHIINNKIFIFKSKEIKDILDGVSITDYEVMKWIKEYIASGINCLEEEK